MHRSIVVALLLASTVLSTSACRLAGRAGVQSSEVQGSLYKDSVRQIVRAHVNEVRDCYLQGLAKDQNLEGHVVVQFTIRRSGRVSPAIIASSTVKDKSVDKCIAKAVRRWRFSKPQGGGSVIVTYPFVLEAG